MTVFVDTFTRANGSLGANWTDTAGVPAITNGAVTGTGSSGSYANQLSDAGYQEATCRLAPAHTSGSYAGVGLKMAASGVNGFFALVRSDGTNWTFGITAALANPPTWLTSVSLGTTLPAICTITMSWDNGELTARINGGNTLTYNTATYFTNTLLGLGVRQTTIPILDWQGEAGAAAALSVTPEVIGNYGTTTELTFTGTGTAWTAGTPGSPTFTCDHGTLSAQVVASETSATATYDPGDFLGTVTFTDPSTGATDTCLVTSDPNVVPPGGACCFDQDFIDLADRTGDASSGLLLTTDTQITTIDETQDFNDVISQLWRGLFLGETPIGATESFVELLENLRRGALGEWEADDALLFPTHEQPIKADTDQTLGIVETLTTQYTDLADVVGILGGSPTVLSHQDLKIAIDNIQAGGDNQDVLDMLTAMWGTSTPTLTDIAGLISDISTAAGYNLSDILDAIAALPNGDNSGQITAATLSILGAISALALEVAGVAAEVTADLASDSASAVALAGLIGTAATAFASILALLNEIKDLLIPTTPTLVPPIWPGTANVTFGAVTDLTTVVNIDGPMHGIEVVITSTEPGTSFMQYDDVKSWRHIGGLAFYNDRGMMETYQALNFGKAMYVPKTMAVAQGVKLFKSHLPHGTVTPWTINT